MRQAPAKCWMDTSVNEEVPAIHPSLSKPLDRKLAGKESWRYNMMGVLDHPRPLSSPAWTMAAASIGAMGLPTPI